MKEKATTLKNWGDHLSSPKLFHISINCCDDLLSVFVSPSSQLFVVVELALKQFPMWRDAVWRVGNKIVGRDIRLDTKITSLHTRIDVTLIDAIQCRSPAAAAWVRLSISPVVAAFANKQPWPPYVNYYDVCPINRLPLGYFHGSVLMLNTGCVCCERRTDQMYGSEHDNSVRKLAVIALVDGTRHGVNAHAFIKWLNSLPLGEKIDPVYGRKITGLKRLPDIDGLEQVQLLSECC
jgi:hypothetical protein